MWIYGVICIIVLFAGYMIYGKFLEKIFGINQTEPVPSKSNYDGVDFVPTNKWVLLGHHFSSIAGAGPIVGPIIAGLAFGWLPAILWILLGAIFIGGVHDFSSLVISMRNQGKSLAEIASTSISKRAYYLFLTFIWLSLMYVIAVFAELAAESFASEPAVAQISLIYVFVALAFGVLNSKGKIPLWFLTIISLVVIGLGFPFSFKHQVLTLSKDQWVYVLIGYAFVASILPVWILLQPRDYLSSFLLFISVIIGMVGIFLGGFRISYPPVKAFYSPSTGPLVPFLFITIACGAISGFHSLVSSGTTSKQLDHPKNSRFVAYGGMLLEAITAAVALSTLMIFARGYNNVGLSPSAIYAEGIGRYLGILGLSEGIGKTFGLLILSAFILTTLDTATRISRYIFQELLAKTSNKSLMVRGYSTLVSLILPLFLLKTKFKDPTGNVVSAWKIIWPIFGTTNQLLAALVFIVVFVWAKRNLSKGSLVFVIPMTFMAFMTMTALIWILTQNLIRGWFNVITFIALLLLSLALILSYEAFRVIFRKK
ncbi:MAG: carbon starvation protein A [candidate division WOR-3 bacterium]